MLRRQEWYDGNMSTGIVTIHEGKLYYRKCIGTVEDLLRKSDVLDLPGTIGIAHTRPEGRPGTFPCQPYISEDETAALTTNGIQNNTPCPRLADQAVAKLLEHGYRIQNVYPHSFKSPRMPKSGWHVFPLEVRLKLVDFYVKEGCSYTAALARSGSDCFSDNAMATISENAPDSIFALRTTRPLLALEEPGETYLATCRFAFEDGKGDQATYLPVGYACEITREGLKVSRDQITTYPVPEITPETYQQGYKRLCALLEKGVENAMFFDELEYAALDMPEIFPEHHGLYPHAQLVYDVLWQLEKEGRLCKELRTQERGTASRQRWYFWLEE